MIKKIRKTVKKYRHGNIPAAFGCDLWLTGATNVPNLLLKFYKDMNLTDIEVITLIQMFRLIQDEKDLSPDAETLADYMSADHDEIAATIKMLFEKKVLVETLFYDETNDEVIIGYDFEPLFERLSDYWACSRAKEIEKAGNKLDNLTHLNIGNECLGQCFSIFEREFGRPLSPIEIEKVSQWMAHYDFDLVQEALRRAVLMGKRNFRYIDTILLDWSKNNLRSILSIEEHDRNYQVKKPSRSIREKDNRQEDSYDIETNKRKALIKKLYLS